MLHLRFCSTCGGAETDLQVLSKTLKAQALANSVTLETFECGAKCQSPVRLWMQHADGATYVFEGLDIQIDRHDIIATAHAYLASPRGWIDDARPCGRLRVCLTARIPA